MGCQKPGVPFFESLVSGPKNGNNLIILNDKKCCFRIFTVLLFYTLDDFEKIFMKSFGVTKKQR